MKMTNEKARIHDYRARIFVLENKLENIDALELTELQSIINQISILENKIECAICQIDSGKHTKVKHEFKVPSKINTLSI